MKKSIFYYLFAVVCTIGLFTACSDDDDDKKVVTVDSIVGIYSGEMDVKLAGATVVDDRAASVSVAKISDGKVKVSLADFTIPDVLPSPVSVEAECAATPGVGELKLNGVAKVDLTALGLGSLDVTVTGDADGKELDLDIAVAAMQVAVEFDGRK